MAYEKTNWQDLPNQTTPVTSTRLLNMENGIENNDKRLNGTSVAGSMIVDGIRTKNLFDTFSVGPGATGAGGTDIQALWGVKIFDVTPDSVSMTTESTWRGFACDYIEVKANTKYTLSFNTTASTSNTFMKIVCYNVSKTMLQDFSQNGGTGLTITTPANTKYVRIVIENSTTSSTTLTYSNIQFEEGETATAYTRHQNLSSNYTDTPFWTDLTFTSTYWQARSGYTPKFKRVGNMIFLTGQVVPKQALNAGANYALTTSNLPMPVNQHTFMTGTYGGVVGCGWITSNTITIRPYSNVPLTETVGFELDGCYLIN